MRSITWMAGQWQCDFRNGGDGIVRSVLDGGSFGSVSGVSNRCDEAHSDSA